MPSVSSFLPGSTGQPILGLEYSRGARIKESGGVRLTAYYVKALWKSRERFRRQGQFKTLVNDVFGERGAHNRLSGRDEMDAVYQGSAKTNTLFLLRENWPSSEMETTAREDTLFPPGIVLSL
ncbi:hypothetical protein NQZ68_029533 [Dissostichus eleginoides]|nr:hypothetical protein NQZ68_029533 [Dissostichus eleginoides]